MTNSPDPIEPVSKEPVDAPATGTEANPDPQSWDAQLEAAQDAPESRGKFDAARKKTFLKALARGDSLAAAARAAAVSPRTVYNHQRDDERFAAACRAAAEVNAPVIELAAFERGVTGVEEDVISYGKHVGTRVKRSDAILQTLLKGSNPDKYGPQAGFKRHGNKKLARKWFEKKRRKLKEELRPELMAEFEAGEFGQRMRQESIQRITRRIRRLGEQMDAEQIAKGYVRHEETDLLIPPGWVMVRAETSQFSCENREA